MHEGNKSRIRIDVKEKSLCDLTMKTIVKENRDIRKGIGWMEYGRLFDEEAMGGSI